MKKNYLLLFFLIASYSFGQQYVPLLDSHNQWNFTTCYFGCLNDVYYTDGDTIINNKNYKILDGYHFISRTFLLRESIQDKQVFLSKINDNSISEYLLYDFSLSEGDSIEMTNPISPFPFHGGKYILDSIRPKPLVNNINFRHFYFSPSNSNNVSTYPVIWIEGIGSKSLINAPGGYPDINGAGWLSCFYKNENLVFSQPENNSDCTYLDLSDLHLYNDTSNYIFFQTEQKNKYKVTNSKDINTFYIYNINGKALPFSISNFIYDTIDLSNLRSGIYFVIIQTVHNSQKKFKIIIQ